MQCLQGTFPRKNQLVAHMAANPKHDPNDPAYPDLNLQRKNMHSAALDKSSDESISWGEGSDSNEATTATTHETQAQVAETATHRTTAPPRKRRCVKNQVQPTEIPDSSVSAPGPTGEQQKLFFDPFDNSTTAQPPRTRRCIEDQVRHTQTNNDGPQQEQPRHDPTNYQDPYDVDYSDSPEEWVHPDAWNWEKLPVQDQAGDYYYVHSPDSSRICPTGSHSRSRSSSGGRGRSRDSNRYRSRSQSPRRHQNQNRTQEQHQHRQAEQHRNQDEGQEDASSRRQRRSTTRSRSRNRDISIFINTGQSARETSGQHSNRPARLRHAGSTSPGRDNIDRNHSRDSREDNREPHQTQPPHNHP